MTEKPILRAMLSCSSTALTDDEKRLFAKYNPLGISLFARNIENKAQLRRLTDEIRSVVERDDILIAVDQEGGRVRRLQGPEYIEYASMETLGKIAAEKGMVTALKAVVIQANLTANDLHETGINFNYAPVLDMAYPETTPALKSRCFGNDEKRAAVMGGIMMEEYVVNNICPCIKHLPGHGRAQIDPHLNLPVITDPLEELAKDFYPFKQLNYAPAGMTAHIVIDAVDPDNPITQSAKGIDKLIRGEIGFDGLLLSDAIDMHALRGSLGEKTQRCLNAGCDAVCYCLGKYNELLQVVENCGFMSDKGYDRLNAVRQIINQPDLSKLAQEYNKIISDIEVYDEKYDATEVLNRLNNKEN